MPFVSITRLRIRSWRYLPAFAVHALRSSLQVERAEGKLAASFLPDARNTFRTATVWTDEESMRAFMIAGAHGTAMRKLLEWCDEASIVHWTQVSGRAPTWNEAYERMQRDGRRSKVHHPSAAQRDFRIAPPRGSRRLPRAT